MTRILAFLLFLARFLKAHTVHRNIVAQLEVDELDEAPTTAAVFPSPASAAELVVVPLPLPAPDAEPEPPPDVPATMPDRKFRSILSPPVPDGPPPITIDEDGWMHGEKVVHIPTKRHGYKLRGKGGKVTNEPEGYLVHWTATSWGTGQSLATRTAPDNGEGNFVHIWTEHDGTIFQSAPFKVGAPHAGHPKAHKIIVGDDGEPRIAKKGESTFSSNSFFISNETICVGEVRRMKLVDGSYVRAKISEPGSVWLSYPYGRKNAKGKPEGKVIKDEQVVDGRDRHGVARYWQAFTDAQITAHERIIEAMMRRYGLSERAVAWDHAMVDPTRKSDSGLWLYRWLPQVLARIRQRMAKA